MQASSLGDAEHSRPVVGVIVGAVLLLAWPVTIALARHDGAPVGADTPVYVWWARLVGAAGSSSVAMRPGLPSVTATVSASLGVPETVAVAGLGCALVAMVGLCGGALLRAGGERSRTALIGLGLTGLFAGYLASGHLSNAASAALFVLALAFVLDARPRSIVSASLLLGAAGLAHPDFLWVALSIVLAAVAWSIVGHERREAVALAVSGVVGAAVAWLGLMAASAGGSAFDVPTSLDVFLMQTDQLGRLHALFLERFRPKVAGYALWVWIPLSALAARRLDRPLGRLLLSWVGVTIVGVVVGLVWQPFPPHRIVAFAMCLPLLAAIGTAAVAERAPRYAIWIIAGVIVFVAATATIAWVAAPRPFRDPSAVLATAAAAQVAQTPSGPTVVDLPDDANRTAVAVIRWTNLLRAAVPPDRIRDVVVRFPPPSADDADQTALWLSTEAQIRDTFAGASIGIARRGDRVDRDLRHRGERLDVRRRAPRRPAPRAVGGGGDGGPDPRRVAGRSNRVPSRAAFDGDRPDRGGGGRRRHRRDRVEDRGATSGRAATWCGPHADRSWSPPFLPSLRHAMMRPWMEG
jgi:hypothetical protein